MAKNKGQTPEQKRITISSKRQITIPQKFYTELGFENEAICIMCDGYLILQPVKKESDEVLADHILSELIIEGFSGQKLLDEFRKRMTKIKPAMEELLEDSKFVAKN